MKRLVSSDSLGALISICPNSTDIDDGLHNPGGSNNPMREFQAMLEELDEEEGCVEESCQKKRRLSVDQVKALEKNFEAENKLEPDRKVRLAQELGLQPRQVAVWFQNRRARWKTKQLEKDFAILKANHDALKLNFESLLRDNQSLVNQIEELKSKVNEDESRMGTVKEEPLILMSEEKHKLEYSASPNGNSAAIFGDFKDGSSYSSDSSSILNEDYQKHNNDDDDQLLVRIQCNNSNNIHVKYQEDDELVKIEEHDFFGEESCSTLFSEDQPPCLNWMAVMTGIEMNLETTIMF